MEFDYSLYPGRKRKIIKYIQKEIEPKITIVTAYFNGDKYIDETINSVLNQTFPFWEWIIVNDGSTNKESLKKLEEIKGIDSRIKILNKENSGPADSRDLGAKMSSKSSKYLMFLDCDDLIKNTYLEYAYITLETNKNASWAYGDTVNFGEQEGLWQKSFDVEIEKEDNLLVLTALIRKEDFFEVNGFDVKEKDFFEDWYLWLKLLQKEKFPVRINELLFWYRKKKEEESKLAKDSQRIKEIKRRMKSEFNNISDSIKAIQYPKQDYNWDVLEELNIDILEKENEGKKRVLLIFPWLALGGADKFNLDFIKGLSKLNYEFTIITTEPNMNEWRQKFDEYSTIYDLTAFLDRKYWPGFINYIIKKENIDLIMNSNSTFGYAVLPYIKAVNPQIPIIDYIHMEEWYNRNGGFSRDTSNLEEILEKTLVCNENTKNILVNHFGRKPDKIETVYIGVNADEFDPSKFNKNEILNKYKINPQGKKIIGFIARIDLQKRPYLLMKIIKKLKENRDDFLVIIAGEGPLLSNIKRMSKKYNLEENIIFLGSISKTQEVYSMCDITLNCSIKEGLALTSYESLSMGVPVVSADVGGQAELIDNTVGAIVPCLQREKDILDYNYTDEEITNYVNAINTIFKDLDKFKKNARKKIIDLFSIENMVKKMDETLKGISSDYDKQNYDIKEYANIFKEIIIRYFMLHEKEYEWLCDQLNIEKFGLNYVKAENNGENKPSRKEKIIKKMAKIAVKFHIYEEAKIMFMTIKQIYESVRGLIISIITFLKAIILFIIKIIKQIGKRTFNLGKKVGGRNE